MEISIEMKSSPEAIYKFLLKNLNLETNHFYGEDFQIGKTYTDKALKTKLRKDVSATFKVAKLVENELYVVEFGNGAQITQMKIELQPTETGTNLIYSEKFKEVNTRNDELTSKVFSFLNKRKIKKRYKQLDQVVQQGEL